MMHIYHKYFFSDLFWYDSADSAQYLNLALFSRLAFVYKSVIFQGSPVKSSVEFQLQKWKQETRNGNFNEKFKNKSLSMLFYSKFVYLWYIEGFVSKILVRNMFKFRFFKKEFLVFSFWVFYQFWSHDVKKVHEKKL